MLFILQSQMLTENLTTLLNGFVSAIPKVTGALIIALIGFLLAKVVSKFIRGLLKKVKIDSIGDKLNDIDIIERSNVKIELSSIISKLVYYFIILLFVVAATDVLGMPAVSELFNNILNWMPNLITAIIVLVLGLIFSDIIKGAVYTACSSVGIPSSRLIATFVFYFLFINVVISALSQAKVDTSFISSNISILIGGVALAFAIGYGFASRDLLASFLSSYYNKGKFQVGDKIKIEDAVGVITSLDNSTITLDTGESVILIPINRLLSEKVEILSSPNKT